MKVSEIIVKYKTKNGDKFRVANSYDLYTLSLKNWNLNIIELQEVVKVVLLNNSNEAIGIYELSKGGITSSIVDIRIMMSVVLKSLATNIALIHNHPSGKLMPSESDKNLTQKVNLACSYFDIKLIDHLIITKNGYFSFADEHIL